MGVTEYDTTHGHWWAEVLRSSLRSRRVSREVFSSSESHLVNSLCVNDGGVNPDSKGCQCDVRCSEYRSCGEAGGAAGLAGGRWDWGPTGGWQGEEPGYTQEIR